MKRFFFAIAVFIPLLTINSCSAQEQKPMEESGRQVIRKMRLTHCARGVNACEKCREMAKQEKYCLLTLFAGNGMVARPVTAVEVEGTTVYMEYDVVRVFGSRKEALEYADKHQVAILKKE